MNFTHIFFDLDHTLWDYETNARAILRDIYDRFALKEETFHGSDHFIDTFFKVNNGLWQQYNHSEIDRDQIRSLRFERILTKLKITGFEKTAQMNDYFLFGCPRQKEVMDGAEEVLVYLSKKYHLSIMTNGFDDVQGIKLDSCGLRPYFSHMYTSETTGYKKPSREIFDHALSELKVAPESVLMIGDNHSTDILGARNAGITPLLFNPHGSTESDCELQIRHLSELMQIL